VRRGRVRLELSRVFVSLFVSLSASPKLAASLQDLL